MILFWFQLSVLSVLAVLIGLAAWHWPYPSPVIRRWLPGRLRWPEAQIRGWLAKGHFHPGYLAFFYRDPERSTAEPGQTLIAPADGLITSTDCRGGIRYIVIALSFWDMHVQRSPVDGRVLSVEPLGDTHTDGEGREFAFLREKFCPVQTRIAIDSRVGPIAVRLITSVAARRLEAWVEAEQTLVRGQRIGRILLGSTVVLEVPEAMRCRVAPGDRVLAGETGIVEPLPGAV
ncbi:phosphatidylserine decarboxylase [Salinisphaera sp. SPP-AMP-43]|uniref:phosphatidylserine decarboxylase n=1 Tax=Salinisphaera sp. SPP-AMP-43 TaxID=3121288 RepID=UPI003C6DC80E